MKMWPEVERFVLVSELPRVAGAEQGVKAQNGFNGGANLGQTVAFDGERERRERKRAERFFTAWRRVPRNGTRKRMAATSVEMTGGCLGKTRWPGAAMRATAMWRDRGQGD